MNSPLTNRPQFHVKPWELVPGTFVQVLGNFLPKGVRRFGMIKSAKGKQFVIVLPREGTNDVELVNVFGTENLRAASIEDILQVSK